MNLLKYFKKKELKKREKTKIQTEKTDTKIIKIKEQELKLKIIETENKHAYAKIKNEDYIEILIPRKLTKRRKREIIKTLSEKIITKYKQIKKTTSFTTNNLNNIQEFRLHNKKYKIIKTNKLTNKVLYKEQIFYIPEKKRYTRTDIEKIKKNIGKILSEIEYETIKNRIEKINKQTLNEKINQIKVKYLKSKWGSCSIKRTITINVKLLNAPKECLNYVIIHELAHLKEMNHSKQFWKIVEQHCPNYKEIKKEFKRKKFDIF